MPDSKNTRLGIRPKGQARSMRRAIRASLRYSVYERDKSTCQYCGQKAPDVELQIDHVMPVALGGTNHIDNLLTACRDCNIGKGARDPGLSMPSRPLTEGEKKERAQEEARWWAEMVFRSADASVRKFVWEIAAKTRADGVLLIFPHLEDEADEREEMLALLRGFVATGIIRIEGWGSDEVWFSVQSHRGIPNVNGTSWALAASGPIEQAVHVAEVY